MLLDPDLSVYFSLALFRTFTLFVSHLICVPPILHSTNMQAGCGDAGISECVQFFIIFSIFMSSPQLELKAPRLSFFSFLSFVTSLSLQPSPTYCQLRAQERPPLWVWPIASVQSGAHLADAKDGLHTVCQVNGG